MIPALFCSCERSTVGPEDSDRSILVMCDPHIGTLMTEFSFRALPVIDGDTVGIGTGDDYEVRWDWDDDGTYDTPWSSVMPAAYTFNSEGIHDVRVALRGGAFDRDVSGNVSVCVVVPVRLTTNPSSASQTSPDWSRSGTERIAFSWEKTLWCYEPLKDSLWRIGPNSDSLGYEGCFFPDWNPSGRLLGFSNSIGLLTIDRVTGTVDTLVSAAEGGVTDAVCWSPQGDEILFASNGVKVVSASAKTHGEYGIPAAGLGYQQRFCWSPQGWYVAVATEDTVGDGGARLQIWSSELGQYVQEFTVPACGDKLEWSPSGEWISLGFADSATFYVVNELSGEMRKGRLDGFAGCGSPTWSRESNRLAFHAVGPGRGAHAEIWVMQFLPPP